MWALHYEYFASEKPSDDEIQAIFDQYVGPDLTHWVEKLREPGILTPDLLCRDWREGQKMGELSLHPMAGYCYVATEALGAIANPPRKKRLWMPMTALVEDTRYDTTVGHYWLSRPVFNESSKYFMSGRLHLDVTADQFDWELNYSELPYSLALSSSFARTKRCQKILKKMDFKR